MVKSAMRFYVNGTGFCFMDALGRARHIGHGVIFDAGVEEVPADWGAAARLDVAVSDGQPSASRPPGVRQRQAGRDGRCRPARDRRPLPLDPDMGTLAMSDEHSAPSLAERTIARGR
jgi:hypothetical protein